MTSIQTFQSHLTDLSPKIDPEKYREDIHACMITRLNHMINQHNKVLMIRFDVRFPEGYPHDGGNREISELLKRMKGYQSCIADGIDTHYAWVREQVNSPTPHYHVALFIDGSKVQNPYGILQSVESIWQGVIGIVRPGLIHFCCQDGGTGHVMLIRPSSVLQGPELEAQTWQFDMAYRDALHRIAYLAKTYSKGNAPYRVREYGYSQGC